MPERLLTNDVNVKKKRQKKGTETTNAERGVADDAEKPISEGSLDRAWAGTTNHFLSAGLPISIDRLEMGRR